MAKSGDMSVIYFFQCVTQNL